MTRQGNRECVFCDEPTPLCRQIVVIGEACLLAGKVHRKASNPAFRKKELQLWMSISISTGDHLAQLRSGPISGCGERASQAKGSIERTAHRHLVSVLRAGLSEGSLG